MTRCELKQGLHLANGFAEFEDKRNAIHQENGRKFMVARIAVEWSKGYKNKNEDRVGMTDMAAVIMIKIVEDEMTDTIEDLFYSYHPDISVGVLEKIDLYTLDG